MNRQICIQQRVLHQGCKVLSFEFPEGLEIDERFKFRLIFVNEFIKEDPDDAYIYPYCVYSGVNNLYFLFNRYTNDRTFICQLFYAESEETNS